MPVNDISFRPYEKKRSILLVEDEPVNREILKLYLKDTYDVIVAETGKEALFVLNSSFDRISLILLDLNLPDIHGLDVLRAVREDLRYAPIPVIVMTADSEAEVECLTLGAIDFIPKPYPQQKVVLARILRTIELSEDRDILRYTERDLLTGLYNKEFFYHYALQFDSYHKDSPTDALLLNINHFHSINDRYGKSYGDLILKRLAGKLLALREKCGGIVCRSEADTFLIYCPHRDDYEDILTDIAHSVSEDEPSENRIRLRMGVYSCTDKTLDIERRFDRAKMAADTVRNSFTKSIALYDDSMHESELLAEQLIEDFVTAVKERQFEIFFQPKFNIRGEKPVLCSAEALVRWHHPRLGMINPGIFIPLFEQNGLIRTLDQYVWEDSARHIRDWKSNHHITLPVSVNVSRIDLCDPSLSGKLVEIVKSYGLDYSDMLLEVTESAYTDDPDQIVERVKNLRSLGFRIEMDDFGSGYSSLNTLTTLPIDALKLDMQFIRTAFGETTDTRLLEAMIRLAEAFEVPTIAEGVETEEQVNTLKTMGCDIIQGYYFSKPLPADQFEAFLLKNLA